MTPVQLRHWLQARLRRLQAAQEWADASGDLEQVSYDAVAVIHEARKRATAAGLPQVVNVCNTVKTRALAPGRAAEVLGECLAALPGAGDTLTVKEAAELLGVAGSTLYGMLADGRLRHKRIGRGRYGGTIRIARVDLERLKPSAS